MSDTGDRGLDHFHEDTERRSPVNTTCFVDYEEFYRNAVKDVGNAKKIRESMAGKSGCDDLLMVC